MIGNYVIVYELSKNVTWKLQSGPNENLFSPQFCGWVAIILKSGVGLQLNNQVMMNWQSAYFVYLH